MKKSRAGVAATAVICLFLVFAPQPLVAQSDELDALFEQLQDPELEDWEPVEKEIWRLWSQSGSDSMDLLLQRGHTALNAGNLEEAVEHLSALIDHAPDFAEGWNARATAFFHMEKYGLSISDIQQTLALNPRHFGALSGLGMVLETVDEPEQALKAYRAAKEVHPHRPNLNAAIERLEERTGGTSL